MQLNYSRTLIRFVIGIVNSICNGTSGRKSVMKTLNRADVFWLKASLFSTLWIRWEFVGFMHFSNRNHHSTAHRQYGNDEPNLILHLVYKPKLRCCRLFANCNYQNDWSNHKLCLSLASIVPLLLPSIFIWIHLNRRTNEPYRINELSVSLWKFQQSCKTLSGWALSIRCQWSSPTNCAEKKNHDRTTKFFFLVLFRKHIRNCFRQSISNKIVPINCEPHSLDFQWNL